MHNCTTVTYNELGEFLMVLSIGKRTGHSTLKNAKGEEKKRKPPSHRNTHPKLQTPVENSTTTVRPPIITLLHYYGHNSNKIQVNYLPK
jgi:hypothetical protein